MHYFVSCLFELFIQQISLFNCQNVSWATLWRWCETKRAAFLQDFCGFRAFEAPEPLSFLSPVGQLPGLALSRLTNQSLAYMFVM